MLQIVWKSLLHTTYVTACLEIPLTYHIICYRVFGNPSYIRHMLQSVWRSLLHMTYVTECLEIPHTYEVCYSVWRSLLHTTYVTECLEIPLTYHLCYRVFGDPSYIPHTLQSVWRSLLHTTYVTECLEIPLTYHICYRLFGNTSYILHSRLLYYLIREVVTDCLEIPLTYHIQDYFIISSEKLLQIVWKSLLHTTFKITLLSHQRNCYRLFGNPSYIPHMLQLLWQPLFNK